MNEAVQAAFASDGQDALVGFVGIGVVSQLDVAAALFGHALDGGPVFADDHARGTGRDEESESHLVLVGWVDRVAIQINVRVSGRSLVRSLF